MGNMGQHIPLKVDLVTVFIDHKYLNIETLRDRRARSLKEYDDLKKEIEGLDRLIKEEEGIPSKNSNG